MASRPGVVGPELGEEPNSEKHSSTELLLLLALYLSHILGPEYCSTFSLTDGSKAGIGIKDPSVKQSSRL